jgi:hypothetical protein
LRNPFRLEDGIQCSGRSLPCQPYPTKWGAQRKNAPGRVSLRDCLSDCIDPTRNAVAACKWGFTEVLALLLQASKSAWIESAKSPVNPVAELARVPKSPNPRRRVMECARSRKSGDFRYFHIALTPSYRFSRFSIRLKISAMGRLSCPQAICKSLPSQLRTFFSAATTVL